MTVFIFELVLPLVVISSLLFIVISDYKRNKEWKLKFKEGTRVYTSKDEDGVIICVKNNKAFVKFFHGNYWRYLDDLIPYNEYLD